MTIGIVVLEKTPYGFQTINPTSSTGISTILLRPAIVTGKAQASAGGTLVLASGESSMNDVYTGWEAQIIGGTGAGEKRKILTYTGSTVTCTVYPNWVATPDTTSQYRLTPPVQMEAKDALITVETYQVRFRVDGGAPLSTVGHVLAAGSSIVIKGTEALRNLRLIDTAAGASTVRVSVFY